MDSIAWMREGKWRQEGGMKTTLAVEAWIVVFIREMNTILAVGVKENGVHPQDENQNRNNTNIN